MHNFRIVSILSCLLLSVPSLTLAAESVSFQTTAELQNISGNDGSGCPFIPGTYEFAGQSVGDGFWGCCGINCCHVAPPLTNMLAGEGAYSGSYTLGSPTAVICCGLNLLFGGYPTCFTANVVFDVCEESHRPPF